MGLAKKLKTVCRIYRERDDIGKFFREKDAFDLLLREKEAFAAFIRERDDFSRYQFAKQSFAEIALADQGAVQEHELPLLKNLVEKANTLPGPIIEIGTLFGFTTQKIAFWKVDGKKLITVDNYCWNPLGVSPEEHFHLTGRILWYMIAAGHVELLKIGKDEFFSAYASEAPSMVFIDADHTYEATLSDIRQARRIGARIICGHDYCDLYDGVMRAVNESGGASELCGSLWVLKEHNGCA